MEHLKISIAMCTFNGARYLKEQLSSIASQNCPPDELVVCDDGSTDDTVQILSTFATEAPFAVRMIVNEQRLGAIKNFEKSMKLCKGDIIALCDQDDIWNPGKLATLREAFKNDPGAVYAFSDGDMMDELGAPMGYTLWDAVGLRKNLARFSGAGQLEMLLRKELVTGATLAFRASFRDVIIPIPSDWMHDSWIASLGSALYQGIAVPEALLRYRRHAAQACGWRSKTFWQVCRVSLSSSSEESWKKVEQFGQLYRRILSRMPPQIEIERLQLLRQKEMHLMHRARTRSTVWISRVPKVISELCTGRYRRFSESSWYSVLRDLC